MLAIFNMILLPHLTLRKKKEQLILNFDMKRNILAFSQQLMVHRSSTETLKIRVWIVDTVSRQ